MSADVPYTDADLEAVLKRAELTRTIHEAEGIATKICDDIIGLVTEVRRLRPLEKDKPCESDWCDFHTPCPPCAKRINRRLDWLRSQL